MTPKRMLLEKVLTICLEESFIVFSSLDNEPLTLSYPEDAGVPGIKFTVIVAILCFSN